MDSRFNRHSERLLERFGQRVWRLGVDAGFGCPHRAGATAEHGGRGSGGCIFCAPEGGLAAYQHGLPHVLPDGAQNGAKNAAQHEVQEGQAIAWLDSPQEVPPLDAQIRHGIEFLKKRYNAQAYFLYFQAFSCTNLPVTQLRAVYDTAIGVVEEAAPGGLKGMVVSTRPDCFDAKKAALLAEYARPSPDGHGFEVWLELGLQSAHDATLRRIRRGHDVAAYVEANRLAGEAGLKRAVHVILGLPGEGRAQMLDTVRFVNDQGVEGIKFHDLRLAKGSSLALQFPLGEFMPLYPGRLPSLLADCLELLDPCVEIMRLCADFSGDSAINVFPPPEKTGLYTAVEAELERRGTCQGSGLT